MKLEERHLLQVESLVRPQYARIKCWSHGWPHILGVRKTSVQLSMAENQDSLPCEIAALCHDLGRVVEEQEGAVSNALGFQNHAILSIEPTVKVLKRARIEGYLFNAIIEAVATHSYRDYQGRNMVARILRDSDKGDALGPFGVLRTARYQFGRDLADTNAIIENLDNPRVIASLAEETLNLIRQDPKLAEQYTKVLDFILEWEEKRMFDTKSAYQLFKNDIDYTRKARKLINSKSP